MVGLYATEILMTLRQREYHLQLSHEMGLGAVRSSMDELNIKMRKRARPEILEKVESICPLLRK